MKKFITFVFIFHIFSPNLFAVEKYVVGGINASQFYNIISKPMTGYSVGVGIGTIVCVVVQSGLFVSWRQT